VVVEEDLPVDDLISRNFLVQSVTNVEKIAKFHFNQEAASQSIVVTVLKVLIVGIRDLPVDLFNPRDLHLVIEAVEETAVMIK